MPKDRENVTRTRIVLVLRAIIEHPYFYTRLALAEKYDVHPDTITGDFKAFANAHFVLDRDKRGRYAFVLDKPHQQLKDLLHFSAEDQALLYQAIDNLPGQTERQQKLKAKLGSLYDYSRLGHAYLRKPYLAKVDALEQARREKKQVILEAYRSSNSNTISDRLVEPFHVSPADDMVQTFEVDKSKVNHFRLSRFVRVKILDTPWQHEGSHNIRPTDPFRIVGSEQVMVHLRMSVGAFNELVERFPMTRNCIQEAEAAGMYDFQGEVNARFLGLSNFILGFYHQGIEVVAPDSLRDHLRAVVGKMDF